jgi:hypothetical protein
MPYAEVIPGDEVVQEANSSSFISYSTKEAETNLTTHNMEYGLALARSCKLSQDGVEVADTLGVSQRFSTDSPSVEMTY